MTEILPGGPAARVENFQPLENLHGQNSGVPMKKISSICFGLLCGAAAAAQPPSFMRNASARREAGSRSKPDSTRSAIAWS